MILDFTDAAVEDLQSISDYTRWKWGEQQEEIYLESLWDRFEAILEGSLRYRSREDLFPRCQIASEGKHLILFRIENPEILQIVRILHSAMDIPRHIPDDL